MKLFKKKRNLRVELYDVFNPENYMKESKEICTICGKEIIGIFETAGNMFSHTSYGWWVRDHHPIMWDGPKHWECFRETNEGKEFEQTCIKSHENDKELMRQDNMMRNSFF